MIDIIYVIPAAAFTALLVLTYFIGIEVGRDRGRREQQARDRHPSGKQPITANNVRYINDHNYWRH